MSSRAHVTNVGLRSAATKETLPPQRVPGLARIVATFSLGCTLMIAGVMALARISPPPPVLELPQAYLPDSPVPSHMTCRYANNGYGLCSAKHAGQDVYASYDIETRLITGTAVQTRTYTLSQLVVTWGTPSGITWGDNQVTVYWGARSALIYDRSIRLDTRVDFVIYKQDALSAEPWRGFRQRENPS